MSWGRYNFIPFDLEVPFHLPPTLEQQEQLNMAESWLGSIDHSTFGIPSNYHLSNPNAMTAQLQGQQDDGPKYRPYEEGPMNRFINEPHREGGPIYAHGMTTSGGPVRSLPHAGFTRHISPPRSLSNEMSSASSAQSPAAETDWSIYSNTPEPYKLTMDYYESSSPSFGANSPPDFESHGAHLQTYALPQTAGNSCVNMSQVQGFADPQEVTFEAEEGYTAEYNNMESEKQETRMESRHTSHIHHETGYHTDSAIGTSIKSAASPADTSIQVADDTISDVDAEGESDEQDSLEPDPVSDDEEYTPRSTRRKRASAASTLSRPSAKRSKPNKITKSAAAKIAKSLSCKSCNSAPFKDAYSLSRHIASAHTRPFICVYSFAGCAATFASKNEWKRHVSSQHVTFAAYICTLGNCGQPNVKSSNGQGGAEFNRKDLFTQHLRRMHAPSSVKKTNKVNESWEKQIKNLQVSALKEKRARPSRLQCPVQGCGVVLDGNNCWDERMEHVGKHLERAAAAGEQDIGAVVDQGLDHYLVNWSLRERIIELKSGGGYRLYAGGSYTAPSKKTKIEDDDEDADGEFE